MATLTNEERSAILSARAKNRKAATALITAGVTLPKTVAKKMADLEEFYNKTLAPVTAANRKASKAA
jgi:hypothetical protein